MEQVFVARERELALLQQLMDRALAGQGQVAFVTGEAGAGKTALVAEFARRAQAEHGGLLVAVGDCNAQTGIGDPYLPFREVLSLLTGDVEAKLAQGSITRENAGRLRRLVARSGQILIDVAPVLVDTLVPGAALAGAVGKSVATKAGWMARLEALTEQQPATAEIQQGQICEQYTNFVRRLATDQPLVLVLDDLQWADPASISLLFHLGRRIADSRLLLIGLYRPTDVAVGRGGNRHPLESVVNELRRYFGQIEIDLGGTEAAEGRQFIDAYLDAAPNCLGPAFRDALYQHTEGHPLFSIELLRSMRERGDLVKDEQGQWIEGPTLDWARLPARVEGVIEERLGRLEEELRDVLTVASVEGENFTAEVVARVQAVEERGLVRRLSGELDKRHRLVSAQGTRRLDSQRLSLYRFVHSVFHKYVYSSLDEAERAYLHQDVGTALEALYSHQSEAIAVQLARHFQEAAVTDKATRYLLQAGRRAVRLSAHEEAVGHLTGGLELLSTLPDTPEHARLELDFQIALGPALIAGKGYTAPEVERTYARARELCRQASPGSTDRGVAGTPGLIPVLRGLLAFYRVRADFQTARELAEQLLSLVQIPERSAFLVDAAEEMGVTLLHVGELGPSRAYLEQAISVYDPQEHRSESVAYAHAPAVLCLSHVAWALWLMGFPDQALERSEEALAIAQEISHPFSIVFALDFAAVLHQLRQETEAAQERSEAVIALSRQHGFAFWTAGATVTRGWALAMAGEIETGIALIREGLAAWRGSGAEVGVPHHLALLAEAYGQSGQVEEGLRALAEALAAVDKTGQRCWEAELYRLKGRLLLMRAGADSDAGAAGAAHDHALAGAGAGTGAPARARAPANVGADVDGNARAAAEAEACFRQAIQVARGQEAKSWELRATVSLGRLLHSQGRQAEGQQLLADIHGWFSEGFDTPDLKEARALLDKWSARPRRT